MISRGRQWRNHASIYGCTQVTEAPVRGVTPQEGSGCGGQLLQPLKRASVKDKLEGLGEKSRTLAKIEKYQKDFVKTRETV
jgi:hypothetical protein